MISGRKSVPTSFFNVHTLPCLMLQEHIACDAHEQSWHFVCGCRLDANALNKTADNLTGNMQTRTCSVCVCLGNSFIELHCIRLMKFLFMQAQWNFHLGYLF